MGCWLGGCGFPQRGLHVLTTFHLLSSLQTSVALTSPSVLPVLVVIPSKTKPKWKKNLERLQFCFSGVSGRNESRRRCSDCHLFLEVLYSIIRGFYYYQLGILIQNETKQNTKKSKNQNTQTSGLAEVWFTVIFPSPSTGPVGKYQYIFTTFMSQ